MLSVKSKYRHLNHPVQLVLEDTINLFDFAQWETKNLFPVFRTF